MTTIVRLLDLDTLKLAKGNHKPNGIMCVMEAVAFMAGEPWSDHPQCACPIISTFMRKWNDDLSDDDRQMLKLYIPRLIGTKRSPEVEQRRGWLVADWMVRVHTPAWLELGGMKEQADALRNFPELKTPEDLASIQPLLNEAKTKADAAWDAAWAAARDAAWDAARDAAWDAAWDAARAAAWDAAWDAARAAAWAAESEKLKPTQVSLQQSALKLLDAMIEIE
jgi:hypothetical protein